MYVLDINAIPMVGTQWVVIFWMMGFTYGHYIMH